MLFKKHKSTLSACFFAVVFAVFQTAYVVHLIQHEHYHEVEMSGSASDCLACSVMAQITEPPVQFAVEVPKEEPQRQIFTGKTSLYTFFITAEGRPRSPPVCG